jgi:predicted DNA-binding transcriptional regulator AlpA
VEQRYLIHREAAGRARMSESALWERIKEGKGPRRIKVKGHVLYRPEDIDAWLDAHMEEPSA